MFQSAFQLVQPLCRVIFPAQLHGPLQMVNHWIKGALLGVLGTSACHPRMGLRREYVAQPMQHAGFANAGFPAQHHHLPTAHFHLFPALAQQFQLLLASDKRRQPLAGGRVNAVLSLTLMENLMHLKGLHEFVQEISASMFANHVPVNQLYGILTDDNRVGLGKAGQLGGNIRRIAQGELLPIVTAIDFAHHHEAGVNAHAYMQSRANFLRLLI